MGAISVGLMSVIAWTVIRSWDGLSPERRTALTDQPLDIILVQPVYMAQIVVAVLGVMAISAEYTTGAIRSTLQAQPRRLTVLAAKAVVLAALTFIVGEALGFLAYVAGESIIDQQIAVHLNDPGVLRAVFGAGLYFTVLALFSFAVGAVIRHTAGAITAVLGLVLVISGLTGLLPGTWGSRINAWMPTNAGQLILVPQAGPDPLLTPWQGMAVFAGWTAVVLLLAAALFATRDA
jgi:ABC-type transport system involved in multi-copper enzyme maturation permease subunit